MPERETRNRLINRMGAWEVADVLGTTVSNLDSIRGLPEPVQKIKASRLWLEPDIETFAKEFEQRRASRTTSTGQKLIAA